VFFASLLECHQKVAGNLLDALRPAEPSPPAAMLPSASPVEITSEGKFVQQPRSPLSTRGQVPRLFLYGCRVTPARKRETHGGFPLRSNSDSMLMITLGGIHLG